MDSNNSNSPVDNNDDNYSDRDVETDSESSHSHELPSVVVAREDERTASRASSTSLDSVGASLEGLTVDLEKSVVIKDEPEIQQTFESESSEDEAAVEIENSTKNLSQRLVIDSETSVAKDEPEIQQTFENESFESEPAIEDSTTRDSLKDWASGDEKSNEDGPGIQSSSESESSENESSEDEAAYEGNTKDSDTRGPMKVFSIDGEPEILQRIENENSEDGMIRADDELPERNIEGDESSSDEESVAERSSSKGSLGEDGWLVDEQESAEPVVRDLRSKWYEGNRRSFHDDEDTAIGDGGWIVEEDEQGLVTRDELKSTEPVGNDSSVAQVVDNGRGIVDVNGPIGNENDKITDRMSLPMQMVTTAVCVSVLCYSVLINLFMWQCILEKEGTKTPFTFLFCALTIIVVAVVVHLLASLYVYLGPPLTFDKSSATWRHNAISGASFCYTLRVTQQKGLIIQQRIIVAPFLFNSAVLAVIKIKLGNLLCILLN